MKFEVGKTYLIINRSTKEDESVLTEETVELRTSTSDLIVFSPSEGVESLRKKISSLLIKPHSSDHRIFAVTNGDQMNEEQANTLLKIFEEPPRYALVIIFSSNPSMMLPTIRSRCIEQSYSTQDDVREPSEFISALEMGFSQYLTFISNIESDKIPDMLKKALESIKKEGGKQKNWDLFNDIARAYLRICSTNSSRKLALESIYVSNRAREKR